MKTYELEDELAAELKEYGETERAKELEKQLDIAEKEAKNKAS